MSAGTIVGGERVVAMLRGLGVTLPARVERVVTEFAIDVLAQAKRNAPVKHGRLSRSLHYEIRRDAAGVSGTVGTDVEYAAMVELGFHGQVNVRAFMRNQVMAWGRAISPRLVSVRASTRNVNRAPNPYLVPALMGARPTLAERLRADLANMGATA